MSDLPIVDITRVLDEHLPVWPGDPPFKASAVYCPDGTRVTRLVMGSHIGTHVDHPAHLGLDGSEPSLQQLVGAVRVVAVDGRQALGLDWVGSLNLREPRLLLKTGGEFPLLTVEAAVALIERGVVL